MTSKGIAALSGLPRLRHLKLWKARGIDDAAVPAFLRMENLEVLELPETSITAQGLARLSDEAGPEAALSSAASTSRRSRPRHSRKALPGCLVSWWRKPNDPEPRARATRRQLKRRRSTCGPIGLTGHIDAPLRRFRTASSRP